MTRGRSRSCGGRAALASPSSSSALRLGFLPLRLPPPLRARSHELTTGLPVSGSDEARVAGGIRYTWRVVAAFANAEDDDEDDDEEEDDREEEKRKKKGGITTPPPFLSSSSSSSFSSLPRANGGPGGSSSASPAS